MACSRAVTDRIDGCRTTEQSPDLHAAVDHSGNHKRSSAPGAPVRIAPSERLLPVCCPDDPAHSAGRPRTRLDRGRGRWHAGRHHPPSLPTRRPADRTARPRDTPTPRLRTAAWDPCRGPTGTRSGRARGGTVASTRCWWCPRTARVRRRF